ncbi:MAG: response regulator [Candidatus Omnitrophica bacterium]|nr:response regulator [Candidatus Omnitrophota bacterium]
MVKKVRSELEDEAGYNVYSMNTGDGVLDKLNQVNPDLIILDLVLPHESGFQVAKEIKSSPKYKNTPIIATSLKKDDIDKHIAALSGAAAYLEKPINTQDLLFRVKDILSRKENNQ